MDLGLSGRVPIAADLKDAAERMRSAGAREVFWQAVEVGDDSGVAAFVEALE